jgi:hypothetical protein
LNRRRSRHRNKESLMGCRCREADNWDDDADDSDCGDDCQCESDVPGDEDDSTVPCPHCGRDIHEDSPQCPHCGEYLSDDAASGRHHWLVIIGVILCLCGVVAWFVNS